MVDARIEAVALPLLLLKGFLQLFLLFVQRVHHFLSLFLLALKVLLLAPSLVEEFLFLLPCPFEFSPFLCHLVLLFLYNASLCPLVAGVFLHIAQATVHLLEIFGREYEHQFVLRLAVAIHVHDATGKFPLTFRKFLFQLQKLAVEYLQVIGQSVDFGLYGSDIILLCRDFSVDERQISELRLDVFFRR